MSRIVLSLAHLAGAQAWRKLNSHLGFDGTGRDPLVISSEKSLNLANRN